MLKPSYADIKKEFTEGSAIAPDVFDAAIEIVPDILIDDVTREVLGTPIADLLGYRYTRFTDQAKPNLLAAVFSQETGEAWQLKIFGDTRDGKKSGQYLAPKGIGDKAYFSPVPDRIASAIAQTHNLPALGKDETFWEWFLNHPEIPLALTEGGKKALSVVSLDQPAISLYGCQCGAKSRDENGKDKPLFLLPELQPYVKGRRVNIAFDRDSKPSTIKKVEPGIYKLAIAIKKAGGRPYVATWDPKNGKGIDDIHARKGREYALEILDNAIPFDTWKGKNKRDISDIVDISLNQQFLTLEDLKIPDNAQLICIKSGKGTGKTEVLKAIAEQASREGIAVLPIGHRVKLLSELCQRLGIDYRTDKSETKSYLGYALCFNSLHSQANPPFNPENWYGSYIFLDEIEQSLDYLLNSSLDGLKRYRVAIIETFKELLREAIAGGGKIILCDAYLSKRSIACIQKRLGIPVETWVVQNTYIRETPRSLFGYESKAKMLSALLDHIYKGGRPLILTGSQTAASKTSSKNLQTIISQHCPDRFPLAIDSETTSDPNHEAYRIEDNLRNLLRIDIPIVSPILETGVSIEGSDFDSVWYFPSQAQTVDGVCQFVDRYRANVPRHLCAPKTHTNFAGNGSLNARDLLRGEKRKASAIFRELSDLDHISLYEGESAALVTAWAEYAIGRNSDAWRFDDAIVDRLIEEGYQLVNPDDPGETDTDDAALMMTLVRDESLETEREAIADAVNPTDTELEKLQNQSDRTADQRYQLRKGQLCRRYLTEKITTTDIKRDSEGWFSQLTLHYFLTTGKPFLKAKEQKRIDRLGEKSDGRVFLPDFTKSLIPTLLVLEFLKIPDFFDCDRTLTNDDLREWYETLVIPYKKDIRTCLGITIGENDTPIRFLQRVLGKLGLKLSCCGRLGSRGDRRRFYQLAGLNLDGREAIFSRWLDRDIESVSVSTDFIFDHNQSVAA
ncbi:plasmid replication protein, CyRepA1 family [Microcystis aeruginosa]|uniref:DUF3854 domain-containing protein n=1 Tax=Microcystis aeruginosa PCC 9808 TaxID=1160284 RepID=I4I0J1_MICAE|nr:plasmid replication protein, CyRepA1 family [Microcystis aeruginosa]CCI27815.1 conserved hypothetical protein [Microcystis aeruginosa PCC 9808]